MADTSMYQYYKNFKNLIRFIPYFSRNYFLRHNFDDDDDCKKLNNWTKYWQKYRCFFLAPVTHYYLNYVCFLFKKI